MVNKTFVHPAICKGNIQEKKTQKPKKQHKKTLMFGQSCYLKSGLHMYVLI
jgi:hypothetical protein